MRSSRHFLPIVVKLTVAALCLQAGSVPAGTDSTATVSWSIDPDPFVFPETAVGATSTRVVTLSNAGDETIYPQGFVFTDPEAGFAFEYAVYRYDCPCIPAGTSTEVAFSFTPTVPGLIETGIVIAEGAEPIPVSGVGVAAVFACSVLPLELQLGPAAIGTEDSAVFRVTNNGNLPLTVAPAVVDPNFVVPEDIRVLDPGEGVMIEVRFRPQEVGTCECDIDLGTEVCSPLHCTGEAVWAPGADQNLVGFFFDSGFGQLSTEVAPPALVPAYLALLDCSSELGVGGWECRAALDGPAVFAGWTLEGAAINLLQAPDFLVGTGVPLPPGPGGILLATASVFVLDASLTTLSLQPLAEPSLPGEMAWLTGDNDEIWPMRTITGSAECAWINSPGVAVTARTPVAESTSGRVVIRWPRPTAGDCDGCIVLRRTTAGEPEVIGASPLPPAGDTMRYVDEPHGVPDGTTLYYSYAVVADGREVARSPEVAVTLSMPAFSTRLLPNVPNPFNPRTTVAFELSVPGRASLRVHDAAGRVVRTLVDGERLDAGRHEVIWNGRDDRGGTVASGTYFVRLIADDLVTNGAVTLLK